MKRVAFLLMAIMVLQVTAISAMAVTTTEEKSRQYGAAIDELEAYLETPDGSGGNLYGISDTVQ